MSKTKVLIVVKTYPSISGEYGELVCNAGFLEDGRWIRIYPIPFRLLDDSSKYKKWQWIELDLVKNQKDFRIESYRPRNIDDGIEILRNVGTENDWEERKRYVLPNIKTNLQELINEAKNNMVSLAVLKPKEVLDFIFEPVEREWNKQKFQKAMAVINQKNLFDSEDKENRYFELVKKIPFKFSYKIKTEGSDTINTMMIEDWELGALYWNCLKKNKSESVACAKVKEKYFDEFVKKRDILFFIGTTKEWHNIGKNPFIIIGTFTPKSIKEPEATLF